jgi:predicted negative regulator of RcsB-dependent stress response
LEIEGSELLARRRLLKRELARAAGHLNWQLEETESETLDALADERPATGGSHEA